MAEERSLLPSYSRVSCWSAAWLEGRPLLPRQTPFRQRRQALPTQSCPAPCTHRSPAIQLGEGLGACPTAAHPAGRLPLPAPDCSRSETAWFPGLPGHSTMKWVVQGSRCSLSQFQRPEVQGQGMGQLPLSVRPRPAPSCWHVASGAPYPPLSVLKCPFRKHPNHTGLGPTLWPHVDLITYKDPISK